VRPRSARSTIRRASAGRRRGVALVLVLWLVIVLGAIAAEVAATARTETNIVLNIRARTAARYAAESGIVAGAARIEALLDSTPSPLAQIYLFRQLDARLASLANVDVGAARFTVAVADLNARLDLNAADEGTLHNFFRQFTTAGNTDAVVDAIEDWVDQDSVTRPHGAEVQDYAAAHSRYVPRNGPLQHVEELTRIRGVSPALALAVAPYVTVWGDGLVNVNSAPEQVLAALPGMSRSMARSVVMRRRSGEVFTSADALQLQQAPMEQAPMEQAPGEPGESGLPATATGAGLPISFMPTRILLISRGWLRGHLLTHEIQAVYGVAGQRLVLQAWQERDL
jgi:general secretion pathway protein K